MLASEAIKLIQEQIDKYGDREYCDPNLKRVSGFEHRADFDAVGELGSPAIVPVYES